MLQQLIDDMIIAFTSNLALINNLPIAWNQIIDVFHEFDNNFNETSDSKLNRELKTMTKIFSFELKINRDVIKINVIMHNDGFNILPLIIHAINTFCHLFPYNYDGLIIYLSLDRNQRKYDIDKVAQILKHGTYDDVFEYLKTQSGAFTVSGLTNRQKKLIILSKSDEIIKLLFHEMVHFIGFDRELLGLQYGNFGLDIAKENLNLSEAYTEFISIILNAAYYAIHLYLDENSDIYDIFDKLLDREIQYSINLSTNLLRFYGFNANTVGDFFRKQKLFLISPIPTWEYILLRTQLLLNIDKVISILNGSWRIREQNVEQIIDLMKLDEHFIDVIKIAMANTILSSNLSYTSIDFNGNNF